MSGYQGGMSGGGMSGTMVMRMVISSMLPEY